MKPLDPFLIDLEKTTLIEASAGTGKTYTITTLYCRLAAKGYPVEAILVVTFTEAAAAELTLRIRTRLSDTLAELLAEPCEDEDDLTLFLRGHEDPALVCKRLQFAITCFDQASIMTIHSFCLKILKENAFESRSLFDIELMPDRSLFLRQVSFDFFTGRVNNMDSIFLSYLNSRGITPESFAASFNPVVSRPGLFSKPGVAAFEDVFDEYRKVLKKIHDILLTGTGEIIDLMQNSKGIDKRSYSKKNVPVWLANSLKQLEINGVETLFKMTEKGDPLYKFTQTRLRLKTKSGEITPEHDFFDLCDCLLGFHEKFENNLIHLKIEFLDFFNQELEKMKKAKGICFFDDLVNDLAAALEKHGGKELQEAVRQTYNACLIDEFQDTDPRQYDIFSSIFSFEGTPFFMIGDPKQAIYAFRGGDIFAYLKASKESDQRFTLEKNYRSAPLLVKGINETFASRKNPFLYEPIEFSRVSTPPGAKDTLIENDVLIPPLQFCFVKREGQTLDRQGFIGKETAKGLIPKIVADDILALVQSQKRLVNKASSLPEKISPEDIAVLVRTNIQAELVQNALSGLGIPSYLSKSGSVFESRQALDLHDILWAVHTPDNTGYIKAALCTSVFGFQSDQIKELDLDEDLFFEWQDRFRAYKETWETRGFVSMIMALFHSKKAFLMGNPGLDERGLTNFYHLVELISGTCIKQQLSPYYLMKWYSRQLFKDLRDQFSDELRLESDKKAVAIVTIHKSKGLEYPVVYLPYLWEGSRKVSKENILFHDPANDHSLTLDLGSEDIEDSRAHYETEEQAEQRRLLYVALTRASSMCRIIWGGFKTVETSALGSLLHKDSCKEDEGMINDIKTLASLADQSIIFQSVSSEPPGYFIDKTEQEEPDLAVSKISRDIKASWKMSSFSAVTHSISPESFQNSDTADTGKKDPITLALFPKGAGSGDFFHSVFETLDFTCDLAKISRLVQSKSDMAGFLDTKMVQTATASIQEVLETKLTPVGYSVSGDMPGFCLKDIKPDQRFDEMEFIFPVETFRTASVKKAFEMSGDKFTGYVKRISKLSTQSFQGFIKGFIDLVVQHEGKWYILDYKSNYLGNTYDHYSQQGMFNAMADHHYFLQYYLYLVALHRYLALRVKDYDYDTHFGGVFYLFIRGMHPEKGCGVFFDRPAKKVVSYLSENL